MMGTKFVEERTSAGLFNCFQGDTPVFIYKDGNIALESLKNIGDGTEIQIPILDNGRCIQAKATCHNFGEQDIYEIVFRHNLDKSNYRFSYSATKDHRWILSDGTETTDLKVNDAVSIQPLESHVDSDSYNEGFVHGIVFGDGYQHNQYSNRYMIRLCGKRDKSELNLLESTKDHRSTVYCESNNCDPFLTFVTDRNLKQVPSNTDPSYLKGFVEGWLRADFWTKPSNTYYLESQSLESIEWLKKFAPFAGYTIRDITADSRPTNFGDRNTPLNRITLSREESTYKVESITKIGSEKVWCLTVDDFHRFTLAGGLVTGNCAFRSTEDIDQKGGYIFGWMMDALMVGIGVGFDTKGAGKIEIKQPVWDEESTFVIPDSREGWVKSVVILLDGFFSGEAIPKFDYSAIRPYGTPIKGFGGTASGSGPLEELHKELIALYTTRLESDSPFITSTDIVDTENLIGKCVVAGNVRRSAALALGAYDDKDYLTMKNDQEKLRNHRWGSNNSFHAIVGQDYEWHAKQSQENGEPGYIWLDNARTRGRFKDGYRDDDLKVAGFNPCFSGDTLIATADGRGAVPIEQLALEGSDVPVYSMNPEDGKIEIKMGRNPRITGVEKELLEITLDDNSVIRVTPNHKFYLRDGTVKEASELEKGDSLPRIEKRLEKISQKDDNSKYLRINTGTRGTDRSRIFEHRIIAKHNNPDLWNDTYNEQKKSGWIKGGLVVHHKDFNKLNNKPDNLEIMTWADHCSLHAKDMSGERNPMWGKKHSSDTKNLISKSSIERWSDDHFIDKQLNTWTEERRKNASLVMSDIKNRMNKQYYIEQESNTDLNTIWIKDRLYAKKECEVCSKEFTVAWSVRGQACCSISCSNKQKHAVEARREGLKNRNQIDQSKTLELQVQIYNNLLKELGRKPLKKEWEKSCSENSIPHRIRTEGSTTNPYALTSYNQLSELSDSFNHKVINVKKIEGKHTVYNISVDDFHTVGIATKFNEETGELSGIYTAQCVEQQLESAELCCLCETFPAKHDSYEDYLRTLKIAYMYGKTVTLANTHWPETNAIMLKNRRIGLSQSGVIQAFHKFGRRQMLDWCDKAYQYVTELDKEYSDWLCVPRSVRMTSIKPSGTVSLLNGSTPGIHYPEDEFYIRRIRFAAGHPLVSLLEDAGYHIEDCIYSPNTKVVSFPVQEEYFIKGKRETTMWEQLEIAAQYQYYWADNSVSVTVTFKPEEADDLKTALEMYETRLKAVSFLRYQETGYQQAPYEPITEELFLEMSKNIKPLDTSSLVEQGSGTKFCDGEFCEI